MRGDVPVETFFQLSGTAHNQHMRQAGGVGEDGEVLNHWNLDVQRAGLDVRQYFFSNRVVSPWNSLPLEVKNSESVNQFKNLYDEHYYN